MNKCLSNTLEGILMVTMFRDAAALLVIVSFVVTVGTWSELIHAVA